MLLQKCLLGPGRGGLKLNTNARGAELGVPLLSVSDGSLYGSDSLLARHQRACKWERCFTVNPNQLVAARPPTCAETEGLCQPPSQRADLTPGYSQASCPSHLMRPKLFHHLRASRSSARNIGFVNQRSLVCPEALVFCNLCGEAMVAVGTQQLSSKWVIIPGFTSLSH